ncbi:MAG: phosphotransferase [Chloroflexota bacterium]
MSDFQNLSRDEQHEQLQKLGEQALTVYFSNDVLAQLDIQFVSDSENTVFHVCHRTNLNQQSYMLRIHGADLTNPDFIEGELRWLAAIREELPIQVPTPVAAMDGSLVQTVTHPDVPNPRLVVVFEWLPGDVLGDIIERTHIRQIGAMMAQLHNHGAQFELPEAYVRASWDNPAEINRGEQIAKWLRNVPEYILSEADRALCIEASLRTGEVMKTIDTSRDYGLMHCDIHPHNCLLYDGQISIIDFDDCRLGSFGEDIGITLTYFDDRPDYEQWRDTFFEGYTSHRALPHSHMGDCMTEIEAYMVSRGLGLLAWMAHWSSIDDYDFGRWMRDTALARAKRYMDKPTVL